MNTPYTQSSCRGEYSAVLEMDFLTDVDQILKLFGMIPTLDSFSLAQDLSALLLLFSSQGIGFPNFNLNFYNYILGLSKEV